MQRIATFFTMRWLELLLPDLRGERWCWNQAANDGFSFLWEIYYSSPFARAESGLVCRRPVGWKGEQQTASRICITAV